MTKTEKLLQEIDRVYPDGTISANERILKLRLMKLAVELGEVEDLLRLLREVTNVK